MRWLRHVVARGLSWRQDLVSPKSVVGLGASPRLGRLGQSKIEMHEARLRILYKLEKVPARRVPARAAVTKAIGREQALINLESAKLSLSIGEFNEARAPEHCGIQIQTVAG